MLFKVFIVKFDHGITECCSRCSLSNLIMALQNAVQGVHKSGILHEKIMENLGKLFW